MIIELYNKIASLFDKKNKIIIFIAPKNMKSATEVYSLEFNNVEDAACKIDELELSGNIYKVD